MSCECYTVLQADTAEELAQMVHEAICDGRIPVGGVSVSVDRFDDKTWAQAVSTPSALINTALLKAITSLVESEKEARKA